MREPNTDLSFRVDPAELDTFVEKVSDLRAAMDRHVQTFESLKLPSGVFGRLPGISSKAHDAYSHHVSEGSKALAEGKEVLDAAVSRARQTATNYRHAEKLNLDAIKELARGVPYRLGPVGRPGVRPPDMVVRPTGGDSR